MTERLVYGTPEFEAALTGGFEPEVADVLALSARLCAVAGVTVPADATDFGLLAEVAEVAAAYARAHGLRVVQPAVTAEAPYPFLVVTFGEQPLEALRDTEVVALVGHLDVVPETRPGQFTPYLQAGDLYARGAADMKTVVATFLAWMAAAQSRPGPRPPMLLMLSCCEENGSHAPNHMDSVLTWLLEDHGVSVRFAVVGERTGELEWMDPDLRIGPICRENRSWRWMRAEGDAEVWGLAALANIAAAVELGRTTVRHLNEGCAPGEKVARQPGVRSGLVNPFCFVVADPAQPKAGAARWLRLRRRAGASIHAAAAGVGQPTLVETFARVAASAVARFGADAVGLVGVEIGQDGNFNSYDGSGELRLTVARADDAAIEAWWQTSGAADLLDMAISATPLAPTRRATAVGLDIRELLDHQREVEALIGQLGQRLYGPDGFVRLLDAPPWRCPDTHPDLAPLLEAWEAEVGHPSPDLVKLHGNDGGNLVAFKRRRAAHMPAPSQVAADPGDPVPGVLDSAPAVVFGQVGKHPHGAGEFHRASSIPPYWRVLDRWAAALLASASDPRPAP